MTREEAIRVLEKEKRFLFHGSSSDKFYEPAFDMAIEALQEPERKKGKWIKAYPTNPEVWMCSECHYIDEPKWSYCRNCGAEMEEQDG